MRIDAFQKPEAFKSQMDKWIETFRAAKPAKGYDRVLIPGDPERENEERISKEGINVLVPVQKEMKEIADELGIDFNYQG
jgi:LDH2 family malate/lactate/ureidoglycolate dehydrogenase